MDEEEIVTDEDSDEQAPLSADKNGSESKSSISADLIRGHINTIILRTLYERDKYGYEIINEIEKKSHGQYILKQPTLYSALKRLENQGYIKAYWKTDDVTLGGRRKYFKLTDSGKEITEQNQSEWEYSRTVIDNLISDRSFDFSQPAPTPVDFKILKQSVTRVPTGKSETESETSVSAEKTTEQGVGEKPDHASSPASAQNQTEQKSDAQSLTYEQYIKQQVSEQVYYTQQPSSQAYVLSQPYAVSQQPIPPASSPLTARQDVGAQAATQAMPQQQQTSSASPVYDTRSEEEKRIAHENFLKLIASPVADKDEKSDIVPHSEDIDTGKLIYNNKPETERDYKNLINGIFNRTIRNTPDAPPPSENRRPRQNYIVHSANVPTAADNVVEKGTADGLKIYSATATGRRSTGAVRTTYDKCSAYFKSSAVVAIITLIEFIFCLLFMDQLNISLAYPFVLLIIGLLPIIVSTVLLLKDYGRGTPKPTSNSYLSVSVIATFVIILIICIASLLIKVNFNSAADIMSKIVIPSIFALNIPVFAASFYLFIK